MFRWWQVSWARSASPPCAKWTSIHWFFTIQSHMLLFHVMQPMQDFSNSPAVWKCSPLNTSRTPNAGLMSTHRLRRWVDIYPALCCCLVFTGDLWESEDINVLVSMTAVWYGPHGSLGSSPGSRPSKHHTPWWFDVGSASQTLGQHQTSTGPRSLIFWDIPGPTLQFGLGNFSLNTCDLLMLLL